MRMNNSEYTYMYCPFPDCEEILIIDGTYEDRFFSCENAHKFCSVCKTEGWHQENECLRVKFYE